MKTSLGQWFLRALVILLASIVHSCSSQLSQRVSIIQQAFDYSNIDRTLAIAYTDDIRFEIGTIILEGKQQMRAGAEWDSIVNTHLSFSDFRMNGDTVICKCTEENDLDKLLGVDHNYFDPVTFVFKGSRIKYVNFQRTAESRLAYNAAFGTFIQWASKERGQDLAELMPTGKFVVSAQTAKGWLVLVKEWLKANKSQ